MNLSVPPPAINQPPALQLPQYQFQNNNVHQYYPNQISNFNPHRQIAALPQLNGYSPAMPQSQYGFPPPGKKCLFISLNSYLALSLKFYIFYYF